MTDTNDTIQFDPEKIAALKPFKTSDYLDTDECIAAYLREILSPEDGGILSVEQELGMLRSAIGDAIEALDKRTALPPDESHLKHIVKRAEEVAASYYADPQACQIASTYGVDLVVTLYRERKA